MWQPLGRSGSGEAAGRLLVPDYVAAERAEPPIFDPETGNTIIVALDDSAITGPEHDLRDMEHTLQRAVANGANAILGFPGLFARYPEHTNSVARILNLTLSTEGPHHLDKVEIAALEEAWELGYPNTSEHVNMTSPNEPEMLQRLGKAGVARERLSRQTGANLELLAHMYPRTILNGKEYHYHDLTPEAYAVKVRHGARVAADLGATIVKVPFTGDAETFATVVESTYGRPVVMAGGRLTNVPRFLLNAHAAMEAGARGIAVGRNYFQRSSHEEGNFVLLALSGIVHRGLSGEDAVTRASIILDARLQQSLLKEIEPEGWGIIEFPKRLGGTWTDQVRLGSTTLDRLARGEELPWVCQVTMGTATLDDLAARYAA